MASVSERSSSSRSTASLMPGRIVVAFDATRTHNSQEFKHIIRNIQMRGNMIQEVDTITVLGVLHKLLHPMGFQMQIDGDSFVGTRVRAIKEEVSRMVDSYIGKLKHSAEECEGSGVVIEVKIVVGAPLKNVIVHEAIASNATWVVLDRHLKKELRFYLKQIPCKVAQSLDNFSLKILRSFYSDKAKSNIEHESFYSLSKLVPAIPSAYNPSNDQSVIISPIYQESTSSHGTSGSDKSSLASSLTSKLKEQNIFSPDGFPSNSYPQMNLQLDVHAPRPADVLCSKGWDYSEIQTATDNFSSENLLGEDGYGLVYKGQLKDGQLIAVKVLTEANTRGFSEFHTRLHVLSLACHKNVVMLLGYCCRENVILLVYEYICDRSLEWHLFDNMKRVLAWHQRHAIAVGIAKGLRFLHEECRGSPVLHRDMRPSNIFLTNEFVPLLADCGLANERARHTKFQGNFEYHAPEYAENDVCSVKVDVFAFGIMLIQLISGRKVHDLIKANPPLSLREWAMPLIEMLKLDKLVDPRLGDSYGTYELYQMARVAYLCLQNKPALRPTAGEVLLILEGENDRLDLLTEQLIPVPNNVQRRLYPQDLDS